MTGSLSNTSNETINLGYLSFVRLIGTVYFKKNLASVTSKLGIETPVQLFNSIDPSISIEERHKIWYQMIKKSINPMTETQRLPTLTALERHWKRSCWIKEMWRNSQNPCLFNGLNAPDNQGWKKNESEQYAIDWEDDKVTKLIQSNIDFLNKSCSCKSGYHSKRCGCRKKDVHCGAGCECHCLIISVMCNS